MGAITTSIVVQFGSVDDEDFHLSAEIDSRDAGFNDGITSFLPGDSPVFLVYKSPELVNVTIDSSSGGTSSQGTGVIEQIEYITFANEKTQSIGKPIEGSATIKRLAGVSGATVVGDELVLPASGIAVYKVTYDAKYYAYKMINIPIILNGETSFPVVVVVVGSSV